MVFGISFCMHTRFLNLLDFREAYRFSSEAKEPCVENFSLLAVVSLLLVRLLSPKSSLQVRHIASGSVP